MSNVLLKDWWDTTGQEEIKTILPKISKEELAIIEHSLYPIFNFNIIVDPTRIIYVVGADMVSIYPKIKNRLRLVKLNNDKMWKDYNNWTLKNSQKVNFKMGYQGYNTPLPDDGGTFQNNQTESVTGINNPIEFINLFKNQFQDIYFEIRDIFDKVLQHYY